MSVLKARMNQIVSKENLTTLERLTSKLSHKIDNMKSLISENNHLKVSK